MLKNTVP